MPDDLPQDRALPFMLVDDVDQIGADRYVREGLREPLEPKIWQERA